MDTVVDAFCDRRGGTGSLTVLGAGGTVRWSEVHDRARRVAAVLRGHGIGPGSRVGLLADTRVDLVCAVQGVWLAGAAVTVLSPRQARRVVSDARLDLVVLDSPSWTFDVPVVALDGLLAQALDTPPATPATPAPTSPAILQYTSGSTREPRGVPVSHGNLAANLAAIRSATRHEQVHGCVASWLPLYHDMGLVGGLTLPMACGCPLVLQSPTAFAARPIGWLEAIATHRATATAAPNFAWALLARALAARPAPDPAVRLDSLRFVLSGGEPIDPAAMTRFIAVAARHGLDPSTVVCGYGLAEATLAVTFAQPGTGMRVDRVDPIALETRGWARFDAAGRALVRLGRPVPGTRLRVVDRHNGHELDQRRVGRIEISGPGVVGRYWGEAPFEGGWLRTGDLGYLAEDDLVVCGRESDVLFAAGRNVYPQDVEAAAGEVPGVHTGNVVAFGVPGQETGDRLVVAVESSWWGDHAAAGGVRAGVHAAIVAEVGLAPTAVITLPPGRLPKTSSGKLRRTEARRRYLTGDLSW